MPTAIDISGRTFGRLTVIGRAGNTASRHTRWRCLCQCGAEKLVSLPCLRGGNTKSCGCLKREREASFGRKHGRHGTPEYSVWRAMIGRCENHKDVAWSRYGGRGVTVCARWRHDFAAFYEDMGPRPAGTSIERIVGTIGYEPGNCVWATPREQQNNIRSNRRLVHDGRNQTLIQWSRETGLKRGTIATRLDYGWTVADALTRPLRDWRKS